MVALIIAVRAVAVEIEGVVAAGVRAMIALPAASIRKSSSASVVSHASWQAVAASISAYA